MIHNENTPEQALRLYETILVTANKFLTEAKRFEISALRDFDPSFSDLAEIMKDLASIIRRLADEIDPTLSNKALDYADTMSRMALAITQNDANILDECVKTLESRPFV